MGRIGSLFVNLALEDASFIEGLKRAKVATSGFGEAAQQMAKVAAAGFAAVAGGAALLAARTVDPIMRAVDSMDDLSKAAQKVGTSVSDLSRLRWAGALSDVSDEKLQAGLTKLNVALASLAGKATPAGEALKQLGVHAGASTASAVQALAARFAEMPDGVQKSALAVQVFGKAGAEMIPLLNSGADGLAEAAKEAERLGLVIDTQTARAAESFNDNLTRLGQVQGGIITQIAAGMVPALAAVTNELVRSAGVAGGWQEVGKGIANVMLSVAEAGFTAYEAISQMAGSTYDLLKAGAQLRRGDWSAAVETIQVGDLERAADISKRRAMFARLRGDIATFKVGDVESGATGLINPDFSVLASKAAAQAAKKSVGASSADIRFSETGNIGVLQVSRELVSDFGTLAKQALTVRDLSAEIADSWKNNALEDAQNFAKGISSNLAQAVVYGQSIGDALVNSFKAAAAEALANGLFGLLLGKDKKGGLFGSIVSGIGAALGYGGPKASGGAVSDSKYYLVGENGPELFAPGVQGQILSNSKLGGGGTVINVDARGATDPAAVERAAYAAFVASTQYTARAFEQQARPRLARSPAA